MIRVDPPALPSTQGHPPDAALRNVAEKLEATFLSEMLKAAKIGEPRDAFGGGIGEEQFSSMLRMAKAEALAASGGVGLSEHIFNALRARAHGPLER